MVHKFEYSSSIAPDEKRNCTRVELKIPLSEDTQDFRHINWEHYYQDCRRSLHAVATKHGLEIIVWSIDLDESFTSVSHYVTVRGVWFGILPLHIMRALRPTSAYRTLGFLKRAVQHDWRVRMFLSRAVESEKLHRYAREGKRLDEPLSSQLLMRAITETHWQHLISPIDKPWAYINTATRRIYERDYQTDEKWNGANNPIERDSTESGDELYVADFPKMLEVSRFSNNAIAVMNAKAEGRKWSEIQSHLTDGIRKPISASEVNAISRRFRRAAQKLRPAAIADSTWKPRTSSHSVYRERLPNGEPWGGLWTYTHRYQGKELELLRLVMNHERKNLFKK
ncbi:MAG: hypothetical protein JWO19_5777 [Bryobacterales bacterium]|nr:hypothetical protein [Bryobacterales bacterium]